MNIPTQQQQKINIADEAVQQQSSPFPKNQWYVIAMTKELEQGMIARKILNVPLVIFRDEQAKVVALEDRCCHRGLPLSCGHIEEGKIRCGYHGLLYNGKGQCVEIPGQDRIPSKACVKAFDVREQQGLIWLWYSPDACEPDIDVPDYPYHEHEDYLYDGDVYHYQAPYQLIHDNLLDLSHLAYVHVKTIGGNATIHMNAEMKTMATDRQVVVQRHMLQSDPPPTYQMAYPFKGKIDRWQEIDFRVTYLLIWTGAIDAGTDRLDNPERGGFHMRGFHAITPESLETCHYFWTISTNPQQDREHIAAVVVDQTRMTFDEDKVIIEQQYRNLKEFADAEMVGIHIDVGLARARRIIQSLI